MQFQALKSPDNNRAGHPICNNDAIYAPLADSDMPNPHLTHSNEWSNHTITKDIASNDAHTIKNIHSTNMNSRDNVINNPDNTTLFQTIFQPQPTFNPTTNHPTYYLKDTNIDDHQEQPPGAEPSIATDYLNESDRQSTEADNHIQTRPCPA